LEKQYGPDNYGSDVYVMSNAGGLVGRFLGANDSGDYSGSLTISNSSASTTITNAYNSGGLIGAAFLYDNLSAEGGGAEFTIEDSSSSGSITADAETDGKNLGGVLGYQEVAAGSVNTITNITRSHSSVSIFDSPVSDDLEVYLSCAGGLVGEVYGLGSFNITESYSTGNIGSSEGSHQLGGLVGELYSQSSGGEGVNITRSYSTGDVYGYLDLGGILGGTISDGASFDLSITNSYSTGDIGNGESSTNVGGIVGNGDYLKLVIDSTYASGDIGLDIYASAGGIVGSINSDSSVSNSFYSPAIVLAAYYGETSSAIVGYNGGATLTGNYYTNVPDLEDDGYLAGGVDSFKGNGIITNNLFDPVWDTSVTPIWVLTAGAYPTLNAIAADNPVAAPSSVYVNENYNPSYAGGLVWEVNAFNKIQRAMNAVASSGTVYVASGNYNLSNAQETLVANKPLSIIGQGIEVAEESGTVINSTRCSSDLSVEASDVTVQGVYFKQNDGDSNCAQNAVLYVGPDSEDNPVVNTNILQNDIYGGASGVSVGGGATTTISNNLIHDNGRGIYFELGEIGGASVSGNNIHDNTAAGIEIAADLTTNGGGVTVSSNTIGSNAGGGIIINSGITGISITGNTITDNLGGARTGIHTYSATGNSAHYNKIYSSQEDFGVTNEAEALFDASSNYWGTSTEPYTGSSVGPYEADNNPSGSLFSKIQGNVKFRPFSSVSTFSATSTVTVSPDSLADLFTNGGSISIASGAEDSVSSTSAATVSEEIEIEVATGVGTSSVVLPAGVEISMTDTSPLNASLLEAGNIDVADISGLTEGLVAEGAFQWGIPNLGLTFSDPITLNIFVGTDLNGKALTIYRSLSLTDDWVTDGIVSPGTCTVSEGICTFQTTKASYFVPTGDGTLPVITLLGNASVSLTVGDSYIDAGATASDDTDGDLTSSIVTVNSVNTAVAGTYTVTYDVTDASGNAATRATRTVTVSAPAAPSGGGVASGGSGTAAIGYVRTYPETVVAPKTIAEMTPAELQAEIVRLTILLKSLQSKLGIAPVSYSFMKDLIWGSRSEDVMSLQKALNSDPDTVIAKLGMGSAGNETTFFGLATKNAVIKFQKKHGINPTGFVGPFTRAKLNSLFK